MAELDEMTKKFVDMTKEFHAKAEGLMTEITSAFGHTMESAVKNYVEMQGTYLNGYTGIANGAQKANGQLLESMDANFVDLKKQMSDMYAETQTKANQAIDSGASDFQKQCEELIKKFPMLPEKAYKDTLAALLDSKGKVNGALDKQYKDVVAKLEKNFLVTKKEFTFPELKKPNIPPLDVQKGALVEAAKGAVTTAMNSVKPVLNNATKQLPGPSKNAK